MTLKEVSEKTGVPYRGDPDCPVLGIKDTSRLNKETPLADGYIYFIEKQQYLENINSDKNESIALGAKEETETFKNALVVEKDARLDFINLLNLFDKSKSFEQSNTDSLVHPKSKIGENTLIYPGAIVMQGAQIGDNCVIFPGAIIEYECKIGNNSTVRSGAIIGHHCVVGNHCIVYENSVIGSDGFGHYDVNQKQYKIPQIGSVHLADYVEVGACTAIDRGTIEETSVGEYSKIDNHVQVGHNCIIGKNVYIAGKASLSGSITVGDKAILAGGCGIADHINIAPDSIILAGAGVIEDTEGGKMYFGYPARPAREMHRINKSLGQLPDLIKRLKQVEQSLNGSNSSD